VIIYGTRAGVRRKPRGSVPAQTYVSLIDHDLYAVLGGKQLLGFVQRVGNVFVALSGRTYSLAVEVGQSLIFDRSVAMVRRSSAAT
jgi:hypothetical protein